MKKLIPVVLIVAVVGVFAAVALTSNANDDYIRIHIRANSNETIDQEVKYMVRNSVVTALAPAAESFKTKQEMYDFLQSNLDIVESAANERLVAEGFRYKANVYLDKEEFPARTYNGLTLDAGVYDALIVELGEADGNNWWCVVYPQLCFVPAEMTDEAGFKYESIIKDLIDKFPTKRKTC